MNSSHASCSATITLISATERFASRKGDLGRLLAEHLDGAELYDDGRAPTMGQGSDLSVLEVRRPLHRLLADRSAPCVSLETPRKRPGRMNRTFVVRNPR